MGWYNRARSYFAKKQRASIPVLRFESQCAASVIMSETRQCSSVCLPTLHFELRDNEHNTKG